MTKRFEELPGDVQKKIQESIALGKQIEARIAEMSKEGGMATPPHEYMQIIKTAVTYIIMMSRMNLEDALTVFETMCCKWTTTVLQRHVSSSLELMRDMAEVTKRANGEKGNEKPNAAN